MREQGAGLGEWRFVAGGLVACENVVLDSEGVLVAQLFRLNCLDLLSFEQRIEFNDPYIPILIPNHQSQLAVVVLRPNKSDLRLFLNTVHILPVYEQLPCLLVILHNKDIDPSFDIGHSQQWEGIQEMYTRDFLSD